LPCILYYLSIAARVVDLAKANITFS
jgi:hypothetical protein